MASQLKHTSLRNGTLPNNWADPNTPDELAVDSRKYNEIKSWLTESTSDILLLTGPPGCGKTCTIKVLAKHSGYYIREWITPLDRDYSIDAEPGVYMSQVERFEDFLFTASRYKSLFTGLSPKGSLLLVEDYPNIFLRNHDLFHDVLRRYKSLARSPIIFIFSDDQNVKPVQELFPVPLQFNLGITHVSLNPVTKTRMVAAVKRMASILQAIIPGYKVPPQDTLHEICDSCNGDVRNAMLTLQMKPQEDTVALFDLAMKPQQKGKKATRKGMTQEEAVVTACSKDERVGLLHAVGRVLNPKWCKESEKSQALGKRKRKIGEQQLDATVPGLELVHNPNAIVDSFLSTSSTFLLFVQENYLSTFSSIESAATAADYLSSADVMMTGVGLESTHEMSFNLGIRGVMVANRAPVRAWNPVHGPRFFGALNSHKEIVQVTQAFFPIYPASQTVLMMDLIPYMSALPALNLSADQYKFVKCVGSMEPIANFCESFRNFKPRVEDSCELDRDRASYILGTKPSKECTEDETELHISEDESEEEIDCGAQNLTLLEAVIAEDEKADVNYSALLDDDEDDMLLLP